MLCMPTSSPPIQNIISQSNSSEDMGNGLLDPRLASAERLETPKAHRHGQFACESCDTIVQRKADLERHRLLHDPNALLWHCGHCESSQSSRKDKVKDHIVNVHKNLHPIKPLPVCVKAHTQKVRGYMYASIGALEQHNRDGHGGGSLSADGRDEQMLGSKCMTVPDYSKTTDQEIGCPDSDSSSPDTESPSSKRGLESASIPVAKRSMTEGGLLEQRAMARLSNSVSSATEAEINDVKPAEFVAITEDQGSWHQGKCTFPFS